MKSTTAPRLPDCFQKSPKKVSVADSGQILAVAVDTDGRLNFNDGKPPNIYANYLQTHFPTLLEHRSTSVHIAVNMLVLPN